MFIVSILCLSTAKIKLFRESAKHFDRKITLMANICHILFVHLEQWVFRHYHDRLLFVVLQQLFADIFLIDHQTEHIFTEPACRHDKTTLLSPTATP